ncbi:MAG: DUF389 domain-containing protein [Patescibacteria group bacterium]
MTLFARLRAIQDKDKAALVRQLMENSTPDFDYFYLIGLSTLMATMGLLLNSGSIVIGSMLIAPLMYPILGVALGLVMSNYNVLGRSVSTLTKSVGAGLGLSVIAAFFFGDATMYATAEVMSRTEPHLLHFFVAVVAGAAVAYVMARPEWSATLPGVAIAVALIPPLAAVGVGIAALDPIIIKGASLILGLNFLGIIFAAVVIFLLMNLSEQQNQNIAVSTIKREEQKVEEENQAIEEVAKELSEEANQ